MRTHENEPFVVNRDVRAVMVPAGVEVNLKPGQAGYITQSLGGSFTVYIEGNLFRISGEQADAIGKERVSAPELPPNATEEDVRKLAGVAAGRAAAESARYLGGGNSHSVEW